MVYVEVGAGVTLPGPWRVLWASPLRRGCRRLVFLRWDRRSCSALPRAAETPACLPIAGGGRPVTMGPCASASPAPDGSIEIRDGLRPAARSGRAAGPAHRARGCHPAAGGGHRRPPARAARPRPGRRGGTPSSSTDRWVPVAAILPVGYLQDAAAGLPTGARAALGCRSSATRRSPSGTGSWWWRRSGPTPSSGGSRAVTGPPGCPRRSRPPATPSRATVWSTTSPAALSSTAATRPRTPSSVATRRRCPRLPPATPTASAASPSRATAPFRRRRSGWASHRQWPSWPDSPATSWMGTRRPSSPSARGARARR